MDTAKLISAFFQLFVANASKISFPFASINPIIEFPGMCPSIISSESILSLHRRKRKHMKQHLDVHLNI
jgi:hypothetical protein